MFISSKDDRLRESYNTTQRNQIGKKANWKVNSTVSPMKRKNWLLHNTFQRPLKKKRGKEWSL